jgi:cobalt-zinc-cadmium efflux system protein
LAHNHPDDSHEHSQKHSHAPADFGKAFAIGIALNIGFVLLEVVYGIVSNSVALLADAGHNLSDVLGLVMAWAAGTLAKRAPTPRFTYGLRGSSILAALFNAMFLLITVGAILWEAIGRFSAPEPIASYTVMAVAAAGILVNGVTAWLFSSGAKSDVNIRGAFLHMAADALVSAAVVISGFVILKTDWLWLDPAMSVAVCMVIVWGTWGLLRESVAMSMAAVPSDIDPQKVRTLLMSQPGVVGIHDLHIWHMGTTEIAMTCHLLMPTGHPGDEFIHDLGKKLAHDFNIAHPTVQIEINPDHSCAFAPDEVL